MAGVQWVPTEDGEFLWTTSGGEGPPLVLCHGGPGLWDDQGPVAGMVEDLATVHRYDQRGCGRSSGSGPYTVARFVADLEALREHFGHETWMVGGHSWGATLALRYALAHPGRVRALLYLCGTGVGQAWKRAYRAERGRRLTAEQLCRRNELKAKGRRRDDAEEREYRTLSWAPDYADRGWALELAAEEADASTVDRFPINERCNAALNAEVDADDEARLLDGCRQVDAPTLVVHGTGDPRPAWALDGMVAALPRAELRLLKGVGHIPWVEDPGGLRSVVRGFLRVLPSEGVPGA